MTIALDRKPDDRPRNGRGHRPPPVGLGGDPRARRGGGSSSAASTRCSRAWRPASWKSSSSATAARTTRPQLSRGRPAIRFESSSDAAASKPAALRAGDEAAPTSPAALPRRRRGAAGRRRRAVLERLRAGAIAARPPVRYESGGASAPVRSYYRARSRMPALLGLALGRRRLRPLRRRPRAASMPSRIWSPTISGSTGSSTGRGRDRRLCAGRGHGPAP